MTRPLALLLALAGVALGCGDYDYATVYLTVADGSRLRCGLYVGTDATYLHRCERVAPAQPQAGTNDTLTPGGPLRVRNAAHQAKDDMAIRAAGGSTDLRATGSPPPGVTPDPDSRALACDPHAGRRALVLAAQAQAEHMGLIRDVDAMPSARGEQP